MKTTFSNKEIAHYWLKQKSGDGRNISFYGDKFYSYNTVIAKHEDGRILYLEPSGWSATTQRHFSQLLSAIDHHRYTVIVVSSFDDVKKNIDWFEKRLEAIYNKGMRARTQVPYREYNHIMDSYEKYLIYVEKTRDLKKFWAWQGEILTRYDEMVDVSFSKKEEAKMKQLNKFLGTDGIHYDTNLQYIRIKADKIETSDGVEISATEAKEYWQRYKQRFIQRGDNIAGFCFYGVRDGIMTIGCHKMSVEHLEQVLEQI